MDLGFPSGLKRAAAAIKSHATALLEFVGIAQFAHRTSRHLSYGDQRRLEIARALATEPLFLALDEPAAGLNDVEVQFLMSRLKNLQNKDMTIILVEHNMKLVMNVADEIFVMDHGEYLFDGKPAAVQSNPKVIAAYLGSSGTEI